MWPQPEHFRSIEDWARRLTQVLQRQNMVKWLAERFEAGSNLTFTYNPRKDTITITGAATGTTDLSYNAGTRLLESSSGNDVTLPLVNSTEAGLAPASGGGTSNFLRADGTWAAPAGGGGALDVEDEGVLEVASATTLNFVGAGVTVTDAGSGVAEVSIPGGGGGNPEGRAHVVPTLTDFTWVNQGAATATQRDYGIVFTAPGNSGANILRLLARAAPSTPYEIRVRLRRLTLFANFHYQMIGFRDSGTGRLVSFSIYNSGVTPISRRDYWTNETTFNATGGDTSWPVWPEWMRIRDDGTNIYGDLSVNGDDWLQQFSLGRTAFAANPNQVWFGSNFFPGTGTSQLQVLSWEAL
jgi:hypothetical protein